MALLERFKIMSGFLSKKGNGAGNHPPNAEKNEEVINVLSIYVRT
jgi:hypothetical protein